MPGDKGEAAHFNRTSRPLVFYRDNPASVTHQRFSEQWLCSYRAEGPEFWMPISRAYRCPRPERGRIAVCLTVLIYKTCVAVFFRDVNLLRQPALLRQTRKELYDHMTAGIFALKRLSPRKRLMARCFLKNRLTLARGLDALISRKRWAVRCFLDGWPRLARRRV